MDEILDSIAKTARVTAIHPGYGFLSENAAFAEKVIDKGLTWIGPPPNAMRSMGSKAQAKDIMQRAGVPITPGYFNYTENNNDNCNANAEELLHHARIIGFPVLIKAVMGGGGKGMRLVWKEEEFHFALQACQRESLSAFGDGRVLLEKYLVHPRHVEVQILADSHGNVVYLHERDCSLQRRHQKIIEEAPASDLSSALRTQLGQYAVQAAQAVGYVGAGTVEFLIDTQTQQQQSSDPLFYFCEMNTRLQVEHPITELITGDLDLVEWQIRVAHGEKLGFQQDDIPCIGHAFEARIYAEQPHNHFLPATGTVWHHRPPVPSNVGVVDGIRVDTGLKTTSTSPEHTHDEISVYYDPMISKLIVHDVDRTGALQKLVRALQQYQIAGVANNIDFLIACANHPVFAQAGKIHTGFLEQHPIQPLLSTTNHSIPSRMAQCIGAFAIALYMEHRIVPEGTTTTHASSHHRPKKAPWSSHWGSWRLGGEAARPQRHFQLTTTTTTTTTTTSRHHHHRTDDSSSTSIITCISNRDGSFDILPIVSIASNDDSSSSSTVHVDGTLRSNGDMQVVWNRSQRMQFTTRLHEDLRHGILSVRMWPKLGIMDTLDRDDDVHDDNDNTSAVAAAPVCWELDIIHPLHCGSSAGGADDAMNGVPGGGTLRSPMPGKIRRVHYSVGDSVVLGDVILVLEAMKMEHPCKAPCAGILTEIRYQPGDIVEEGAILCIVDADTSAPESLPPS
jgi:3-methylcrotonyl-CoA carboxylase alpha subunit